MDDFERELRKGFLEETEQILGESEHLFLELEKSAGVPDGDPQLFEELFRIAHNIKGSAAAVGFDGVKSFTHKLESLLLKLKKKEIVADGPRVSLLLKCNDRLREMILALKKNPETQFDNAGLIGMMEAAADATPTAAPRQARVTRPTPAPAASPAVAVSVAFAKSSPIAPNAEGEASAVAPDGAASLVPESIRVSLGRLDKLFNSIGELVTVHAGIDGYQDSLGSRADDVALGKQITDLGKVVRELQYIAISLRMVPLKPLFQKMQRIVRDTSKALGKDVIFHTAGDETEIDRTVIERISDPLVHLIRNAVDHGIETADARCAFKKSAAGTIQLNAYRQGGNVIIEVRDDGHGLDYEKLVARAVEKGLLRPGARLSAQEAYQLIFVPGFSTKTEVTEISGRGVGLDVVTRNIKELQGTIHIETSVGKGTCFRIALPLTLAILDGMVVRVGDECYVVPLASVAESVRPRRDDVDPGAVETMRLRGETMPLFRLSELLGRPHVRREAWDAIALVVRDLKEKPFSLLVDDIVCSQQVVIKPLAEDLKGLPGITGGAVLGDGAATLILDVGQIIEVAA